ncbi:MAG TPA: hypothetical protein VFE48_25465 [Methylomirabilota bacterium]|nr:hypothetical protein [Methylomirabilota bacterium]
MNALETLTEITDLKGRLLRFPAALAEARREAADAARLVENLKQSLAEHEAELLLMVAAETTAEGKPKFTNEAARKAEVTRRLGSQSYLALTEQIADAELARLRADIEVRRLEDEHRAAVAVKDLVCREVDLLVHGR